MSLSFDNQIKVPCADGALNPDACIPEVPSTDDRCSDSAFADANPDTCVDYPRLILKPELSIISLLGQVQFHTYLRSAGDEVEILHGLTYTAADNSVGLLNQATGAFTGTRVGSTPVSVAWQNLTGHAAVKVVAACSEIAVNFCLLLDNSQSTSQEFSGLYGSRLEFAKAAALQFVETLDLSKDSVTVLDFNSSGQVALAASTNLLAIKAAIQAITQTTAKTNIYTGLKAAMDSFSGTAQRCIVLMSDGEDNQGADPVLLARSWKQAGNFIGVVALRAWGQHFDLLYKLATGGFFLSAYDASAVATIENLKGLKSFTCSGECAPSVTSTGATPELNYDRFVNWDVVKARDNTGLSHGGTVDLIGGAGSVWDLVPGNGLYLDMAGTSIFDGTRYSQSSPGAIQSKVAFSFISGHQYRFRINVAGSQRGFVFPVHIRIGEEGSPLLDEFVTAASWDQGFVTYTFTFTPGSNVNANIFIEMYEPDSTSFTNSVGPLVDVIDLQDLTVPAVLLHDDFDSENSTTTVGSYSYFCSPFTYDEQKADKTVPKLLLEEMVGDSWPWQQ